MAEPVISPHDLVIADLCLAADGLLDGHLAGANLVRHHEPGHRARVLVAPEIAEAALEAGSLLIADSETVPVVRLTELSIGVRSEAEGEWELSGTAAPAAGTATGVGQALRPSRTPAAATTATTGQRRVVVLARPPLTADLDALADSATSTASGADVVLLVPISSPSPDGVPVATLLRLAEAARHRLGEHSSVVTATIAWRDPASDLLLSETVADALGGTPIVLSPADPAWRALLDRLSTGRSDLRADVNVDDVDDVDGLAADDVTRTELLQWRPPRHQRGLALFFTGLSGAGKSTIARAVSDQLVAAGGRTVTMLDGDEVRRLLSAGLGFGAEGRDQNVRRIGFVAAEVTRHGGVAICAPIAPYERSRAAARELVTHAGGDFVLVHVATSLADCEARDVKGLYARARSGQLTEFTGISDPYEAPEHPELRVETAGRSVSECADEVLTFLRAGGWLEA